MVVARAQDTEDGQCIVYSDFFCFHAPTMLIINWIQPGPHYMGNGKDAKITSHVGFVLESCFRYFL